MIISEIIEFILEPICFHGRNKWFICDEFKVYLRNHNKYIREENKYYSSITVANIEVNQKYKYRKIGTTLIDVIISFNKKEITTVERVINSYLDNYLKTNNFIITGEPLDNTLFKFTQTGGQICTEQKNRLLGQIK
jgi:hypothetical protein